MATEKVRRIEHKTPEEHRSGGIGRGTASERAKELLEPREPERGSREERGDLQPVGFCWVPWVSYIIECS
jgi:hypothetical protein